MAIVTWKCWRNIFVSKVSCGQKFTVQQYGARFQTANSVINENVPDNIRKKNWSPTSCDFNLLDYAI